MSVPPFPDLSWRDPGEEPEPPRVKSLVERATRFELATFSLATVPWVMRRIESGLLGMRLHGALDAF